MFGVQILLELICQLQISQLGIHTQAEANFRYHSWGSIQLILVLSQALSLNLDHSSLGWLAGKPQGICLHLPTSGITSILQYTKRLCRYRILNSCPHSYMTRRSLTETSSQATCQRLSRASTIWNTEVKATCRRQILADALGTSSSTSWSRWASSTWKVSCLPWTNCWTLGSHQTCSSEDTKPHKCQSVRLGNKYNNII